MGGWVAGWVGQCEGVSLFLHCLQQVALPARKSNAATLHLKGQATGCAHNMMMSAQHEPAANQPLTCAPESSRSSSAPPHNQPAAQLDSSSHHCLLACTTGSPVSSSASSDSWMCLMAESAAMNCWLARQSSACTEAERAGCQYSGDASRAEAMGCWMAKHSSAGNNQHVASEDQDSCTGKTLTQQQEIVAMQPYEEISTAQRGSGNTKHCRV